MSGLWCTHTHTHTACTVRRSRPVRSEDQKGNNVLPYQAFNGAASTLNSPSPPQSRGTNICMFIQKSLTRSVFHMRLTISHYSSCFGIFEYPGAQHRETEYCHFVFHVRSGSKPEGQTNPTRGRQRIQGRKTGTRGRNRQIGNSP